MGLDDVDALHAEFLKRGNGERRRRIWSSQTLLLGNSSRHHAANLIRLLATHAVRDVPLPKTPEGAIMSHHPPGIGAMTVYIKSVWLQVKMAGPSVRPIGWAAAALDSPLEQRRFELSVPP